MGCAEAKPRGVACLWEAWPAVPRGRSRGRLQERGDVSVGTIDSAVVDVMVLISKHHCVTVFANIRKPILSLIDRI